MLTVLPEEHALAISSYHLSKFFFFLNTIFVSTFIEIFFFILLIVQFYKNYSKRKYNIMARALIYYLLDLS